MDEEIKVFEKKKSLHDANSLHLRAWLDSVILVNCEL